MIIDLNVRPKTLKLLKEEKNIYHFALGKDYLETPKA